MPGSLWAEKAIGIKLFPSQKPHVSEYEEMHDWVDSQFDAAVLPNTPEGDTLEMAHLLIKDYENKNYRVPFLNPLEAIKNKIKGKG